MKRSHPRRRRLPAILGLAVLVAAGGFTAYWSTAPPAQTCRACHELHGAYDAWAGSAHRDVGCTDCHGGTFNGGLHGLAENARRLAGHFSGPGAPRLSEAQVVAMGDRCRACHAREYADWLSSGHSLTYADVFLPATPNPAAPPNDDCFRCHGMFYEGSVETLLAPAPPDSLAPARSFADARQAARPAVPCLACHAVHAPGRPAVRPAYGDPNVIAFGRPSREPGVGFYDRQERLFFAAADLPAPRLTDGVRVVEAAADPPQRLCLQCHAPGAAHEAGTGDDRTPRGVHEGLSCRSCHRPHAQDARASCATCHPRLSNCGLDVTAMNTTFQNPTSPYDLHFVACTDCHAGRRPPTPPRP
jgi:hypothetical protein